MGKRRDLSVVKAARVSLWLSALLAIHFASQDQLFSAMGHRWKEAYVLSQSTTEPDPVRITGTAFPAEDPAGQKSVAFSYRLALLAGVILPALWVLRESFKKTT